MIALSLPKGAFLRENSANHAILRLNSRAGRGSFAQSGVLADYLPTGTLEFRGSEKSVQKPILGEQHRIRISAVNSRKNPGVYPFSTDSREISRERIAIRAEWPTRNITCLSAYFRGNPSVRTVCRSNQTGKSDKRRSHATGGCSYRQTLHQFRWANEKSGRSLNHYSEPISAKKISIYCQKIATPSSVLVVDEGERTVVIDDERAG